MRNRRILLKKEHFEYLEILILIMISVTPYINITIKLALSVLIVLLNINRIKYVSKYFYIALVLLIVPAVLDVFNVSYDNSYSGNNLAYPLAFLLGALIASKYNVEEFLNIFEKIVFFLAILSLVGMSVYYIMPGFIERFPTYNYYGLNHRTIYFFNYIYAQGYLMVRNTGIAWEPGVFQILLNLGLAWTIVDKDIIDYRKIIIYSIAIILTRSTTGLLILMVNLFLLVRRNKAFILLLAIAMLVFSNEIYSIISYQMGNKWIGSLAFSNRIEPSFNAFVVGIKHPLGIGSTGYNSIYKLQRLGSFDSYTQVLMRYGYGLFVFMIFTIIRICRKHWYIGLILALSMLSESMWSSVLFTTIYFLYLGTETQTKHEIENKDYR